MSPSDLARIMHRAWRKQTLAASGTFDNIANFQAIAPDARKAWMAASRAALDAIKNEAIKPDVMASDASFYQESSNA